MNSQINFSRIAIMVQPLKDEIAALQLESDKATQQKRTLEAQIDELQRSIARLVSRLLFVSKRCAYGRQITEEHCQVRLSRLIPLMHGSSMFLRNELKGSLLNSFFALCSVLRRSRMCMKDALLKRIARSFYRTLFGNISCVLLERI